MQTLDFNKTTANSNSSTLIFEREMNHKKISSDR